MSTLACAWAGPMATEDPDVEGLSHPTYPARATTPTATALPESNVLRLSFMTITYIRGDHSSFGSRQATHLVLESYADRRDFTPAPSRAKASFRLPSAIPASRSLIAASSPGGTSAAALSGGERRAGLPGTILIAEMAPYPK